MVSAANPDDNPSVCDFYLSAPDAREVEFAAAAGTVTTLEGPVRHAAGDAIVTGIKGERWPISRSEFDRKYVPETGTVESQPGRYKKRPEIVRAWQLVKPINVELSDERGKLAGQAGAWRVVYAPGNEAIVDPEIFPATYKPILVPVDIGIFEDCDTEALRAAISRLRKLLPGTAIRTRIITLAQRSSPDVDAPLWALMQKDRLREGSPIPPVLTLSAATVLGQAREPSLVDAVQTLQRAEAAGWLGYTLDKIAALAEGLDPHARPERGKVQQRERAARTALAEQLIAVDRFNGGLRQFHSGNFPTTPADYMSRQESTDDATDYLWETGAVADRQAGTFQREWQDLVFGQTKMIAGGWKSLSLIFHRPAGLIQLGLLAALAFAGYAEFPGNIGAALLFLYLLALGYAWYLYANAKWKQWEILHQDYRLLAECLRVQYVWSAVGIPRNVVDELPLADHAGSGWVANALRALRRHPPRATPAAPVPFGACASWALHQFIDHQIGYHERTLIAGRKDAIQRCRYVGRWGAAAFLPALIVLIVDMVMEHAATYRLLSEMGHHLAIVVAVVSLATWAAMHKVIDSYGWEHEAQRGELVLSELRRAKQVLEAEGDDAAKVDALTRCGSFFAKDQAAWHALHRARPIEATSGA